MSCEERTRGEWDHEPERIFREALRHMDCVIRARLAELPRPKAIERGRVKLYRFAQRDANVAFLLKMVQLTSNLRAGRLLIEHGFLYDWTMIRRLIVETIESILFLAAADTQHRWTKDHDAYLKEFYAEDVDESGTPFRSRPPIVPRSAIRSYLQEVSQENESIPGQTEPSMRDLLTSLHRFDSGYIHGRASSVMLSTIPQPDSS